MARLGVNIDHVATLRNQRDEDYPSIDLAAKISLEAGADQITIHLREDRRHIRDEDLITVKSQTIHFGKLLNLEIGTDFEIARIAQQLNPDWVCIVPEKREEKTTEGGLDLCNASVFSKVIEVIQIVREKNSSLKVSLFVESSERIYDQIKKMRELGIIIDAVEIHTGEYAHKFIANQDFFTELNSFKAMKQKYHDLKMGYHAGHGLTDKSLLPLVEENIFDEYNIGHWIIGESIFIGLDQVVGKLKKIMN